MQKLELRNYLHQIILVLKSNEIVEYLSKANNINKIELVRLFVQSKGGYDNFYVDVQMKKIFEEFDADSIYNSENFSYLVSFIPTAPNEGRNTFLSNDFVNKFYSFHRSLLNTFKLIDNILISNRDLFDENNNYDIVKAENEGNLVLQIIDNEDVSLSKINSVFESCVKLIETVYLLSDKVDNERLDQIPKVSLIDSGSDININITLPKKAALQISILLKEFWEFISTNKLYKLKKRNEALDNSLSLLKKIKEAEEAKVIEKEDAELLRKNILCNTEGIVFNNALPQRILLEAKTISNRELLMSKTQVLLLEQPKDLPSNSE